MKEPTEITEQTKEDTKENTQCAEPFPVEFLTKRYRHPGHRHKLVLSLARGYDFKCDNKKCQRSIPLGDFIMTCFRCDFDICLHCYHLPVKEKDVRPLSSRDSFYAPNCLKPATEFVVSSDDEEYISEPEVYS